LGKPCGFPVSVRPCSKLFRRCNPAPNVG
jgi:hypothetical protein